MSVKDVSDISTTPNPFAPVTLDRIWNDWEFLQFLDAVGGKRVCWSVWGGSRMGRVIF